MIGDGGDIISASAKVIDVTLPGQWLDPGPLGCLGVGIPFALAAKHLYPEKKVLVINGDGSFGLNGFEFDTALRFNLPIVSIVGNDAGWGQIRSPQAKMLNIDRPTATSLAPTRYDKIVEAMGGYGEQVDKSSRHPGGAGTGFRQRQTSLHQCPDRPGRDGEIRGEYAVHRIERNSVNSNLPSEGKVIEMIIMIRKIVENFLS